MRVQTNNTHTVTLTHEQLTSVLDALQFAEQQNEWREKLARTYHETLTSLQSQTKQ